MNKKGILKSLTMVFGAVALAGCVTTTGNTANNGSGYRVQASPTYNRLSAGHYYERTQYGWRYMHDRRIANSYRARARCFPNTFKYRIPSERAYPLICGVFSNKAHRPSFRQLQERHRKQLQCWAVFGYNGCTNYGEEIRNRYNRPPGGGYDRDPGYYPQRRNGPRYYPRRRPRFH